MGGGHPMDSSVLAGSIPNVKFLLAYVKSVKIHTAFQLLTMLLFWFHIAAVSWSDLDLNLLLHISTLIAEAANTPLVCDNVIA
jgi:hypothetical protein